MAKKNNRANKKSVKNNTLEQLKVQTILNCLEAKGSVYRHYQQWLLQRQLKNRSPRKPSQRNRILFFVQSVQRTKS